MVVGVLAIGQTLVILTAGIDLSVGTVMALGQVVMTKLAIENGMSPFLAIARAPRLCGLRGAERQPGDVRPVAGVHRHARDAQHRLRPDPHRLERPDVPGPPAMLFFGRTFAVGGANFTYGVVFMLVLYAIAWFSLTQTAWGFMSTPSATTLRPRA